MDKTPDLRPRVSVFEYGIDILFKGLPTLLLNFQFEIFCKLFFKEKYDYYLMINLLFYFKVHSNFLYI